MGDGQTLWPGWRRVDDEDDEGAGSGVDIDDEITVLLPALNTSVRRETLFELQRPTRIMAQTATMGPPLSPRETRRSGRRSAPSASTSTSKSPDSPASESTSRNKDPASRPASSITTNNGRSKRPKQEDPDDTISHKNGHSNSSASHPTTNARAKRKGKEKVQQSADLPIESTSNKTGRSPTSGSTDPQEDAEEQGITRCICGMNGAHATPPDRACHTHCRRPLQRKMRTAENSWCNARLAMSGSMVSAWASSPRKNSRTTRSTTASNASRSVIKNSSSEALAILPSAGF